MLVKKNVRTGKRQASITLEPEFWHYIEGIAKEHSCTVGEVIGLIEEERNGDENLCSAIRVRVLAHLTKYVLYDGDKGYRMRLGLLRYRMSRDPRYTHRRPASASDGLSGRHK